MQAQMMRHEDVEEELNEVKAQLSFTERERDRAFNEIREIKRQMNNAEFTDMKEALEDSNRELQMKEKTIESLRSEVEKLKQLEIKLNEKEASLQTVKEEVSDFKSSLAETEDSLSDSRKKVEELEVEVGRRKESEAKLSESFAQQTSQIEQSSILLEKSKLQINSLEEKMQEFEQSSISLEKSKLQINSLEEKMQELVEESERKEREAKEEIEKLKKEVLVHKENATRSNEGDKPASLETRDLLDEIDVLKNELKQAMEAEDNSKKAMDDLAVALKEVASESNLAKEQLTSTEQQLEVVKEEAANLKKLVKSTEETFEGLLKESKKENDRLKNTVDRLRLEAEESILSFNEREMQFVKCIKKTEGEKTIVQEECNSLAKSLREAEDISEKSKEENKKLRDILKQALNEANVAKEASSLARAENSYLKDSLTEKDKALVTLAQETERLRINEAEANETIKELKRVTTSGSKKEVAKLEKENKEQKKERDSKELKKVAKKENVAENTEKDPKENRRLSNTFSFDLNQLWPHIPSMTCKSGKDFDEDPEEDDDLGGSIFDLVGSPVKDISAYHRRTASACSSEDNLNFDNFDEDAQFDDMEIDRTSQGKRKALLRRFGDLLRRKNSHPPKDLPHPPKEVAHSPKEVPA